MNSRSEYSSDSETNVKISSCDELSVSSGKEENVSDNSNSMAYGQSHVLSDHVFHLPASLI
jgi:hypothetical protein